MLSVKPMLMVVLSADSFLFFEALSFHVISEGITSLSVMRRWIYPKVVAILPEK
jgi:hypothetical protein